MRRWPFAILIFAVLLVGGRFIYGVLTQKDDKTQIQQALDEAIKASKEGRAGGVVEMLVDNFKVNESQMSARQIGDFVRQQHPDIIFKDKDPMLNADTAQITSDVTVKVSFMGTGEFLFKDAQILFKKENAMDWLIFPTTKWHLAAVRVRQEDMPQLPGMP